MPPDSGLITVMFTDLVGSTELLDRLGAEDGERLRTTHFRLLREAIASFRGREIKNLGDGLMVVFESVVDGLAAAIAIQQSLEAHSRRQTAPELPVRIGLSVGEAVHRENDYFGAPVVVAKRLCDIADGGQILSTGLVRDLASSHASFSFVAQSPLPLKGFAEPVSAVEVVWEGPAKPVPFPRRLAAIEREPFVGRAAELQGLRRAWAAASRGPREILFVGGEPGIGKTRLVTELGRSVHDDGAVVLYGRCDEGLDIAYQPFVHALRGYVAAHSGEQLTSRLGHRPRELTRLDPSILEKVPDVRPPDDADQLTDVGVVLDAIEGWLAAAAIEAPLLLFLDDLHWAGASTIAVVRHLVASPALEGVLIVGTYRDTELPDSHPLAGLLADGWREPGVGRINLAGLGEDEVAEYVRFAHAGTSVSATAKRLLGATGGNPFFVGELVAHLAEEDSDPARSEPSSFPFPASVQDVLGRRIRRLSPRSIRALTTAAIIGRDFPFALLETVSAPGDVSGLLDDLEAGVRGGLIRDLPGARYTFAHDLVRESLYRDTLEARRLKTHASIAEALETNPPAQWQLEAIAHHYAAAVPLAPVAKAIDFALLAGQAAKQQLAYADAAAHYERGLALLEDAGDVDRDRRAELLLGLAESQLGRGELATYKATAALAATDARRGGSATLLARAAILYASILNVGTDDPLMISMPEEALVALGDSEPQLASLVLSHLASVQAMGLADRKTGGELALRALALARECEDPIALGTALHAHATCMVGAPDIAARLVVLDEAERVWVELGAPLRVSGAGWGVDPRLRAGAYLELGEMERFEQTVDLLETLGAERGDWFAVAFAKSMRRIGLMIYGRFAEAEALLPEMLEAGGQHPDIPLQYAAQLMWSMREQGRVPELLPLMRTAVEQNLENHAFRSGFVMVLADLGEKTEAVAELERLSVGVFPAMPRNFTWKLCLAMLAEACCLLDDKDRCAVLLEHLSPYSGQLVATGWGTVCIGSVDRYLGMLSAALGNLDGAEQSYRAALSLEDQIGAEPFAARTCLWLARLLSMRAGPGDEEEADGLVERGVGLAERLGMAALSSAAAAG